MPTSDRAFRALARKEPKVIVAMLRAVAPQVVPPGAAPTPTDVAATQFDALPAPTDADWVARLKDEIVHVESQGYRDYGFSDRALHYHLGLMLRHRDRRVRTVVLWLVVPPKKHRRGTITIGDVTLTVTAIVLPEVRAELLLADPATACFAAGADAGDWTDDELCARIAKTLAQSKASWVQRHMAVVAAAMHGRYESMVSAMTDANLEPVIIEDLVKFGEDRGEARGEARGLASSIITFLEARKIRMSAKIRAKIMSCTDAPTLRRWIARAATVEKASEIFVEDE